MPGSLENLFGSWKTKLSNETLWHLSGFWMLCTFNHIMAPQYYVYSLHIACLGEQPPLDLNPLIQVSRWLIFRLGWNSHASCICTQNYPIQSSIHQEPIGSYIHPETSGHDSDNSADPSHSPPRTRPRHPSRSQTTGTVCGGTWQCPAQHKQTSRAEFRSGKRGQFLLNQEKHVNTMWGFQSIWTVRVWRWRSVFFLEYLSAIHHWLPARLAKMDDVTRRAIFTTSQSRLPCFSDLLNPCNWFNVQMMNKKGIFKYQIQFMFLKSNKHSCQGK